MDQHAVCGDRPRRRPTSPLPRAGRPRSPDSVLDEASSTSCQWLPAGPPRQAPPIKHPSPYRRCTMSNPVDSPSNRPRAAGSNPRQTNQCNPFMVTESDRESHRRFAIHRSCPCRGLSVTRARPRARTPPTPVSRKPRKPRRKQRLSPRSVTRNPRSHTTSRPVLDPAEHRRDHPAKGHEIRLDQPLQNTQNKPSERRS